MGVIQDFKPLTARAALFYYDIEDFINDNGITSPGSGLSSNCLYNTDHFRLYGGEIELAFQWEDRLRATAAYVYQDHDVEDTGFEEDWTYYLPALLPNHKIKLAGQYRVWKDGWLLASARYVGEREAQKGETLDGYATLDVGFEQGFSLYGTEYGLKLFCSNLTGTVYEEQAGYPMPRQVVGFEVGMKF